MMRLHVWAGQRGGGNIEGKIVAEKRRENRGKGERNQIAMQQVSCRDWLLRVAGYRHRMEMRSV